MEEGGKVAREEHEREGSARERAQLRPRAMEAKSGSARTRSWQVRLLRSARQKV